MRAFMRWVVRSFLAWVGFEWRVRESRGNSIERGERTMTKCSQVCKDIEDNVCVKTGYAVFCMKRGTLNVWIAWTMKQARCIEPLLTESSIHPFFWGSVKVCEIKDTCKGRMKEGTWLGVTSRIPLISSIYLPYISSKVSIYLLHTGQKSIWKPIPRPSWYESFEKDPLQAPQ